VRDSHLFSGNSKILGDIWILSGTSLAELEVIIGSQKKPPHSPINIVGRDGSSHAYPLRTMSEAEKFSVKFRAGDQIGIPFTEY